MVFIVEQNQNAQKVANLVSDLVCDCQLDCSEKLKYLYIHASFLGFRSNDKLMEAKNRIESKNEIKQIYKVLKIYDDDFIYEKTDYKECYLFYNSL